VGKRKLVPKTDLVKKVPLPLLFSSKVRSYFTYRVWEINRFIDTLSRALKTSFTALSYASCDVANPER